MASSTSIVSPGSDLLKQLYSDLYNSLLRICRQKLLDCNKMRSNLADPHCKTVTVAGEVNRLVFAGVFGRKFTAEERCISGVDLQRSSPVFNINNLTRLEEVLGGSFVKCHHSGDISLITPWFVLNTQLNDEYLLKGTLLLPIRDMGTEIRVFIPCAGLDPDTDMVPEWSKEICLKEITPQLDIKELYSLKIPGKGKISLIKNTDYTSIISGQVKEDDYIICHGKWMQVYAIGDDAFYPTDYHDIVRFKNNIERNANKQKFEVVRWPFLCGKIVNINKSDLLLHQTVSITLNKIDVTNMGRLEMTFQNACFNSLGFMTHDTHIII